MKVDQILESVNNYLEKEELHFDYDENIMRYDYGFRLDGVISSIGCNLVVDEDGNGCTITAYPEIGIEKKTRRELEHLLFLLNCNIYRGTWQIDDNNEIRYVKYISLEGDDAVLTYEMLDNGIYAAGSLMQRYADSIVSAIVGASTADEEIGKLFKTDEADTTDKDEDSNDDKDKESSRDDSANSVFMWIKGEFDNKS
ncbi:hypothetical protein [Butyrivibrio sp. AC2005]|uniref:hypothetical protein n=1 Tax=Butyrivibrio sp. AC2005 TaxID=1280672 RepID=UPI0004212A44|nr:hypothetical protein [Butyrivibrio sp. AC2005]